LSAFLTPGMEELRRSSPGVLCVLGLVVYREEKRSLAHSDAEF
jgi:hypothetical protein